MRFLFGCLRIFPFISILYVIIMGCSLTLGGYPLLPAFFLIPVYYWLVYRPDWLPLWGLCCIGLFYDSLLGNELGVSSLLLMLSAYFGQYLRPLLNPQHFSLIWGGFILYSLVYLTLYGCFVSGGLPLLISWMHGIVLYPLMAWGLSYLHLWLQAHV